MIQVEKHLSDAELTVEDIVEHHGIDRQIDKCIEEMGELTQALLKHRHKEGSYEAVSEEVADVAFTLYQIAHFYNAGDDIDELVRAKIFRLKERMCV